MNLFVKVTTKRNDKYKSGLNEISLLDNSNYITYIHISKLHEFINEGDCIRFVVPIHNTENVENIEEGNIWKTNKLYLSDQCKLSDSKTYIKLAKMGFDINRHSTIILMYVIKNHFVDVIDYVSMIINGGKWDDWCYSNLTRVINTIIMRKLIMNNDIGSIKYLYSDFLPYSENYITVHTISHDLSLAQVYKKPIIVDFLIDELMIKYCNMLDNFNRSSLTESNILSTIENIDGSYSFNNTTKSTTDIICKNIPKISSIKTLLTTRINKPIHLNDIWLNIANIDVFLKLSLHKRLPIYIKSYIIYLLCSFNI